MSALLLLLVGGLISAAFVIVGHLARIADAIEAQNRHYGIAKPADADKKEEAA